MENYLFGLQGLQLYQTDFQVLKSIFNASFVLT
jgi:hypothetical protein